MTQQELNELFDDMRSKGLQPMLCDTEVPLYETRVPCGLPTECSDDIKDSVLLPRELLSMQPEFVIPVKGDSMVGAGIEEGNMVKVVCSATPHDGDVVLVCIDGEYTLKTYFEDDEGMRWLVPQNEKYQPIPIDGHASVRILGFVKEVVKPMPRVPSRQCMKIINKARQEAVKRRAVSQERVTFAIKKMAEQVEMGRQWYAVYKPMEEKSAFEVGDYASFCSRVRQEVPNHEHLPTEVELQRMAVQSFRKGVRQWKPNDAPVKGKRFTAYQRIGLMTLAMLESEEGED